MEFKDYYQTLGLSRNASNDEIKKAYRRLARQYHPDVSNDPAAESRFKDVNEAYEVLKDADKRAAYDQFGNQWKTAGPQGGFRPPPNWDAGFEFRQSGQASSHSGFSDFFEALFGNRGRGGRGRAGNPRASARPRGRGEDHHAKIVIDIDDAYHGASRTVALQAPEITADGQMINRTRNLNVKIPAGVTAGRRIRLVGQGSSGNAGGDNGDLYLEIAFRDHPLYRAEGKHIYLDLPITPWEAALGRTVTVPTLGGKVELKIPTGAQSGQTLRLKGRGLPTKPPGDQFIVLKMVTPEAATEEERAFYEKMAAKMPLNPRARLGV